MSNHQGEQQAIGMRTSPVTSASLQHDLKALGVREGMTLLVHSSLATLGWVCGGSVTVIDALTTTLGPSGTLVMPAHTSALSEPSYWQHPPVPEAWWPIIRQETPAFDPTTTPTRGMGATAELFRTLPQVMRSHHPQVSFTARGPYAKQITDNHTLSQDLGEGSPLARLYDLDAQVLLLGVGYDNNTSLHLAEHRANLPATYERQGAPMLVEGQRQWVTFEVRVLGGDDFEVLGKDFEAQTSYVRRGKVGEGLTRLMSQRALVDYAQGWLERHRPTP